MEDLNRNCTSRNEIPNEGIGAKFTRIQHRRFLCGACGETVLERHLSQHHDKSHPEVIFTMDMYEVIEIDELIQCSICNAEMFEECFEEHVQSVHQHAMPNKNDQSHNNNGIGIYKCKICDARGIRQSNRERHHSRTHPYISTNIDIFDFTHMVTANNKVECNICKKHIHAKNLEKHRSKFHPDRRTNATVECVEGFRNIYISDKEFNSLKRQDRFYEVDGNVFLKDSI